MSKLLNSLLKTAVFVANQYYEQVDRAADRVTDRVSDIVDRSKEIVRGSENHTLRNVLSFAAGMGVGVGAGILLAPASGSEIRSSIKGKVRNIRSQASQATQAS
ncbi:MAG TPA: YtxH domain-containing protein [Candidatus Sulfotelmatobacter sp.]|jgi:gas vesicle protein